MSDRVTFRDNSNYHVVTTYAGDVTKVDVYHKPTGIHARGNARRYHADKYDAAVGNSIAYFRALTRLGQKVVTKTIKDLSKGTA